MEQRTYRLQKTDGESDKYWQGIQQGRYFLGHWGRMGTAGQFRLWSYQSEQQARAEFESKRESKLSAGYSEFPVPDEEARNMASVLEQRLNEQAYGYFWEAKKIHPDALLQASRDSDRILKDVARPYGASVQASTVDGRICVLISGSGQEVKFGYPPLHLIPGADYPSRDGYLAGDGSGQGFLQTDKEGLDMAVRLFLTRLAMLPGIHLWIDDSLFGELNHIFPKPDQSIHRWHKDYDRIISTIRKAGWLPGSVKKTGIIEINGISLNLNNSW